VTASGEPAQNALVYVKVAGATLLATVTSESGGFLFPLSLARSQDLSSFVLIDSASTVLEISVQAGALGVASAQIYPQSAKPVPPLVLGQVKDFKNLGPSKMSDLPEADLDLPIESSTPSSLFNVEEEQKTTTEGVVSLDSIEEGEIISSTKPEFFGEGPANTTLTITVESDTINGTVKVASDGDWSWSPPNNLAEGAHKITISWRDATGILRTLTRTFVVQASEGPAFESTPSASPTAVVTES